MADTKAVEKVEQVAKIDLFEDDDEFEEFEIGQGLSLSLSIHCSNHDKLIILISGPDNFIPKQYNLYFFYCICLYILLNLNLFTAS